MPIEYKVYGCMFKCGHRRSPDSFNIFLHEEKCWFNPEQRTCKTCEFEDYYRDSSGEIGDVWWVRDCKDPANDPDVLEMIDEVIEQAPGRSPIPPVIGCPRWREKEIKKRATCP